MRMFIFRELMGQSSNNDSLLDPVSDYTYYTLLNTAKKNINIYTKVFPYIPSDNIKYYNDILSKMDQFKSINLYYDDLKNIQGLIIPYPLKILEFETLFPTWFDFQTRMLSYNLFQ
jgi:hypothetical protein